MPSSPTRVVLLTGATDGLGRALADHLADRPGTLLILHGRDASKLEAVRRTLEGSRAEIATVVADLGDLDRVRDLARQVAGLTDRLDVLVNNAGTAPPDRRLTVDGHELTFAVNYLAPFVLTRELLPLLTAAAPARVVHVASLSTSPVDFDDLTMEGGYDQGRAYGRSKRALVADGFTLAGELPADRVTINSLHPGSLMPTKMVRESGGRTVDTLETGVESTLRLADDPALDGVTGRFYDRQELASAPEAADPEFRRRLLAVTRELVGTE
ncbi:SDR family NAD(P)-dependent oxidoreductase [Patulibacter americanus]|uniref:SDR family NAD(P)-dependent oxidoreductase n=1 Tax=Patulibacter americanus TaxID=588672 RepID=UPI0003B322C0|nr:SDR family NAD(P)-dependent oxidoreductase [Patulibacter americanus]